MKRLLTLLFVTMATLVIAAPSYAMCVRCDYYGTCWGASGTAARCYSEGAACMTAGRCNSESGDPCNVGEGCGPDVASAKPLSADYVVAEVKIERPRVASDATLASLSSTEQQARH